jgi:hypothetical protein
MFFAGLVLVASWKNRMPGLLLPWLILHALSALTGIGFSLYSAILHAFEQEMSMGIGYAAASLRLLVSQVVAINIFVKFDSSSRQLCFYFSIRCCSTAIGGCCWLVIFRYYCQLKKVIKKNTENLPYG